MANPEYLEILKQGAEVWNAWVESRYLDIDLKEANLAQANLKGANLRHAKLYRANLNGANLYGADLTGANLSNADLRNAILTHGILNWIMLDKADLRGAEVGVAFMGGAVLMEADLSGSDLRGTNFNYSQFQYVNLQGANLSDVKLAHAKLKGVFLSNAILDKAIMSDTVLAGVDLREVQGLDCIQHWGPSELSLSTIYLSQGQIPEIFLRGCGIPESFIVQIPALVAAMQPIQFYSCFISYSSKDQEFADRLHADLQAKGVRVWFAPHDMKIGARIRPAIDESIRIYDKLLLVLSESSVSSQWVEQEVETALAREREPEGKTVLFPIRIDDSVMEIKSGWPALLRNTRHVGDFTRWKDHDSYREALERLLRDLKAGA